MKRALTTILASAFCLLCVTGCVNTQELNEGFKSEFYNDSSYYEQNVEVDDVQSNEFPVDNAISYNNGFAWVSYYDSYGDERYALVDDNGNEIFTIPEENVYSPTTLKVSENGLSFYTYLEGEKKIHNLVNCNGEVVATSASDGFERIVACGGDNALVYKHEDGLYGSNYMIAALDQNGSVTNDFITIIDAPKWTINEDATSARYLGDGMFLLELISGNWMYFDSLSGEATYFNSLDFSSLSDFEYKDGYLFLEKDWMSTYIWRYTNPNDKESKELLEGSFALFRDGSFEQFEAADYCTKGYMVKKDGFDLDVYDYIGDDRFKIKAFIENPMTLTYCDDYGILTMTGKDFQPYFTMVDKNGKVLFEPICGTGPMCSGGYIIYKNEDMYHVIDSSGKSVADLEYSSITDFNNGVALYTDPITASKKFMDINGNTLFTTVKTK